MDTSSTITTSAVIGSSSLLKNISSSSVENPISSSLCIVLASLFEVSLILLAALPVGAVKITSFLFFSNTLIIEFIVVVFPVPGPPVIITNPLSTHSFIAVI